MNIRAELAAIRRRLTWALGVRKRSDPFELVAIVVDDREQLRQLESAYAGLSEGKTWPWGLPAALRGLVEGDDGHKSIPARTIIEHATAQR
jgi:hypothetical protein